METKELKFRRDTQFRKQFFVPESFAHPAKMDAQLLIRIVEEFTKPGEVILDPMAGSGTMMLACGLGRHCILGELEGKFIKMCSDNLEKVRMMPQLGYQMGDCQIIQGDARQLEGLLVDKCIFSPPFGEAMSGGGIARYGHYSDPELAQRAYSAENMNIKKQIKRVEEGKAKMKRPDVFTSEGNKAAKGFFEGNYSRNPQNIGNLPYGQIDKIVTSPPHGDSLNEKKNTTSNLRREERLKTAGHNPKEFMGGVGRNASIEDGMRYSSSPDNLGNLPYGNIDSIITSPPYEGSEARDRSKEGWRDEEREKEYSGGSMKIAKGYSGVDSIITSPPYENVDKIGREHGGIVARESAKGTTGNLGIAQLYSRDKDNIGNLKSTSYLAAMLQVYQQCHKVLKPGGLMILVTKNFIRNKQVVRLDLDTIKLCGQTGFTLLERLYRKLPAQSFWRIIYHHKFPDVETIDYEDILVFRKDRL